MLKNLVVLILFVFMVKVHAQVTDQYIGSAEVNSDGLFQVANLKCMGEECIPEGQTFMLPFTVTMEAMPSSVYIAQAEVYLAGVMRKEFNEKLKVYDYKGGIKLFGGSIESLGVNNNSTNLLSINIVRTEFVEQIDLTEDGKARMQFMVYGTLGIAKLTNQFDEFGSGGQQLLVDEFGTSLDDPTMNNDFGSMVDLGAEVRFDIQKLSITGYTRFMTHTSNNLFGGTADANGLTSQTRYNTFQLGLDLSYNVHTGKNGGQLFVFTNVQYGRYSNSMIAGQGDLNFQSVPPAQKELNFSAGIRYTLPTFKRKLKKKSKIYN